jgi:uroporphyrinogen-III synthase
MSTLRGRRVLLTRPAGRGRSLTEAIVACGGEAIELPLQSVEAAGDPVQHATVLGAHRHDLGWIFTSVNAVDAAAALDPGPWPAQYAIGPATAAALRALQRGEVHLSPHGHTSEDLLQHPNWRQLTDQSLLLCTGRGGRTLLQETLRARGARVERLDLYRRVELQPSPATMASAIHSAEIVVCTSTEGLLALYRLAPPPLREILLARVLVVPSARVLELGARLGFAEVRVPRRLDDAAWIECLIRPVQGSPRNPSE